jgi:hypothetical protein
MTHWIVPVYKENFNQDYVAALDDYVAKVIYFPSTVESAVLQLLTRFRVPPIIIAAHPDTAKATTAQGLETHDLEHLTPAT